jgi:hypothetical protein
MVWWLVCSMVVAVNSNGDVLVQLQADNQLQ